MKAMIKPIHRMSQRAIYGSPVEHVRLRNPAVSFSSPPPHPVHARPRKRDLFATTRGLNGLTEHHFYRRKSHPCRKLLALLLTLDSKNRFSFDLPENYERSFWRKSSCVTMPKARCYSRGISLWCRRWIGVA
jgi:hypothetical protein